MDSQENLKKEILEFLRENYIMSIAVARDGKPSASILLYYVDDNFNFHFATHSDSYKARILKENPNISLAVWQHNKMLVQADGTAEEVIDEIAKLKVIDDLAISSGKGEDFWPPLFRIKGTGYVVFKIKLTWLRKLDLTRDTLTQLDTPFEEINFN